MALDFNNAPDQNQGGPEQAALFDEVPQDPFTMFAGAMAEHGLSPPDAIVPGKIRRFRGPKKDKSGWYILQQVGQHWFGAFGDWAVGIKIKWSSVKPQQLTPEQAAQYQRDLAEAEAKRKAEEVRAQARAKDQAKRIWEKAVPTTSHPYLNNKGVAAHGLRVTGETLLVPMVDFDGEIWSLQRIYKGYDKDGEEVYHKRFLFDGRVKGLHHAIWGDSTIVVCEGYATGATIHEVTGHTVVVAYNTSNLEAVCKEARAKEPSSTIIVAADNDRWAKKPDGSPWNPGIAYATSAAGSINARVVIPEFASLDGKPTDFNDLASCEGVDAVKVAFNDPWASDSFPPMVEAQTSLRDIVIAEPPAIECIINYENRGLVPKNAIGVIAATGGVGKTFFLLHLATMMARGKSWGKLSVKRPTKTLCVFAEDPDEVLHRRIWFVADKDIPRNLHAISIRGKRGPLMQMVNGDPTYSDTYHWLDETIKRHPGLEVLILDPLSRLYGLPDENSSSQATAFVAALEALSLKYGLTIFFTHHTSQNESGKISQVMTRGTTALVDACRFQAGMMHLPQETANKYGIENPRKFVEFAIPKQNYAENIPTSLYFQRGPEGILLPTDLSSDRLDTIAEVISQFVRAGGYTTYTVQDLKSGPAGKDLREELKEEYQVIKKDMQSIIDYAISKGYLSMSKQGGGYGTKTILRANQVTKILNPLIIDEEPPF